MPPIRSSIATLATRQHGVLALEQLQSLGLTERFWRCRIETDEWRRIAKSSVVVVAGAPATPLQKCMAAVLSRRSAFISGRTAAYLHGVDGVAFQVPVEITVPYSASGRSTLAKVRRSQHHATIATGIIDSIPTASLSETIFRMSEYVTARRLVRMIDQQLLADTGSADELGDIYLRHQGERMRGMAKLRPILLERLAVAFVPTESELEAVADSVFEGLEIPPLVRQAPLPWAPSSGRVDRLVSDWRLIIELDGRAWHTRTAAFEADRERDNAALKHGYRTVRLTWRMLTERPQYCRDLVSGLGPDGASSVLNPSSYV